MNRPKTLMLSALAALAVLGCSDTAYAQPQLSVTPSSVTNSSTPLVFSNIPSGSASQPQIIALSASSNTSVIIQVSQAYPWLSVSPTVVPNVGPSNPVNLSVRVNTNPNGQILAQGTYQGSFTATVSGTQTAGVTVFVSMTISGTSLFTAQPASLSFSALQGALAGSPASAGVKIVSSGAALNYTVQAQTQDGANWLLLSGIANRQTGDEGFAVSVNPAVLTAAGNYNGTITASSTTTGDSVQIAVTLTITAAATITVTPANPPPFLWQIGTGNPAAQQLSVAASTGSVPFSVRVSPTVPWLVVSPLTGSAGTSPAILTLSATPNGTGIQAGTYTTNVIVTPNGGADLPAVPIKLVVSQNPLLQLSANSLAYTARFAASQAPPDQQVTATASNTGSVPFSLTSDSAWLTVAVSPSTTFATTGAGTTPSTLTLHVNPSGMALGTYTGSITVRPSNGDNYSQFITVTLTITSAVQLSAGPGQLLFSYQLGGGLPAQQTVQVQSSGQPVPFTVSTSTNTCGNNWLSASSNLNSASSTQPATLTVGVVTTSLTAGTCSGTVKLDYNTGSGAASLLIAVTLAVSSSSELVVSIPAGFGVETVQQGGAAILHLISLTSTDLNTPVSFSATATSSPGTWLLVGAGTSVTPQNLVVQILPAGLAPGVYNGSILISSPSLPTTQLTLAVTLTVTSNVTVTVAPASLSFSEAQSGPLPPAQNLTLTSAGGTGTFTSAIQYNSGSNWLQLTPSSGAATGQIQVSVLTSSLSPGDYSAVINFAFQGSATTQVSVNVALHVSPPQTVTVAPLTLNFSYQIGSPQPGSQKITISGSGSPSFTVGTTSSGWLSADVTSGTAPKEVNVSVNTQGLAAGTLNGTVTVNSPALSSPIAVAVTLTVTALPPPQPIRIFNAGSGVAGVISAGEIITITGNQLGPASPAAGVSFKVNASGGVDSNLAGVRVLFDNNPGTPIYVSAGQINVIVPYEINGRLSTVMVVEFNGVQSAPFQLSVGPYALGLFTNNFSGTGQIAAINQNGTYNGVGQGFTPAPQGSVIAVYGTGGGQTSPSSATGSVTPIPTSAAGLLRIPGQITATVGGQPAVVDFAGAAPGLVTGAVQFNVHLPVGVTGNSVSLVITINGVYSSPLGTTIAMQ